MKQIAKYKAKQYAAAESPSTKKNANKEIIKITLSNPLSD